MAEKNDNENLLIPMMALRGLNIFPEMLMTFDVERQASIGSARRSRRITSSSSRRRRTLPATFPRKRIFTVSALCAASGSSSVSRVGTCAV